MNHPDCPPLRMDKKVLHPMREKRGTDEKKPKSLPFGSPPSPAFDSSASVVCARLFLLHRPLDHSSPPPTASLPRRVFGETRQAHWPQALPNWDCMFLVHGEGLASGTKTPIRTPKLSPTEDGKRMRAQKGEMDNPNHCDHRTSDPLIGPSGRCCRGGEKGTESKPDPFFPSA